MKPKILEKMFKDGSRFRVSDSFVQKFLHSVMIWSLRKGTLVAQKLPKDWEDQCECSFFRKSYTIKEHNIPISLYVNSYQTQLLYAPGNHLTWSPTGAKQVSIVGLDEKRAFTLMVSVAADGTLLAFQAIYMGSTKLLLPSAKANNYNDAMKARFKLETSCTKT